MSFNRSMRDFFYNAINGTLSEVTNSFSPISKDEFEKLFLNIESTIDGRIAGDIEDYYLNYILNLNIEKLVKEPFDAVAEIGTLFGGSLLLSLHARKTKGASYKVVSVDPLDGYYVTDEKVGGEIDSQSKIPVNKEVLVGNLEKMNFSSEDIVLYQEYSNNESVIESLNKLKLGALFIDGDHSYAGVKNDWDKYNNALIEGGIVVVDNFFDTAWDEVSEFVLKELIGHPEFKILMVANKTIILRKGKEQKDHPMQLALESSWRAYTKLRGFESMQRDYAKSLEKRQKEIERELAKLRARNKELEEFVRPIQKFPFGTKIIKAMNKVIPKAD